MRELVKIEIPKPEIPDSWDFNSENEKFDELIYGWRRFTIDIVSDLWIFYNKLKIGHNPSRSENSDLPTWLAWLESKGISDKTPLNHFKKLGWIKKELSQEANPIDKIENVPINVKIGDVIKLGDHILYCGDAYKLDIEADAIITDPPYGINYEPDWKKWDGSASDFKKIIGDIEPFNPAPFMKYKTMLFFGANYYSNNLPIGGWLVWDKRIDETKDNMIGSPFELAWFISSHTNKKAIIKRLLHGGVVNADSEIGNNEKRFHPTQKPVVLLKSIIEDLTKENEVIADLFAGSGSILLACELTNRKCISIEIEPKYCSIIISRWEKLTGRIAEWIME